MKRQHYAYGITLAACGLLASFALVPRPAEIALLAWKDKQFDEARAGYERQAALGDRSPLTTGALSQIYLQYGEVELATRTLESYVRDHPADMGARRRLGIYYQYAQRPRDYLLNLEAISRQRETEADLRELSKGFNFIADYDRQIAALKRLIERAWAKPKDYLDLARIEASQGRLRDAAQTMQTLASWHPAMIDLEAAEFHVQLLIDDGRAAEASERAAQWIDRTHDFRGAAQLAGHFLAKNAFEPGRRLAARYPVLLGVLTQIEIGMGRRADAYARLDALERSGAMPRELLQTFLDLAIQRKQRERALAVASPERAEVAALPHWLLANLAEAALEIGRKDYLARLTGAMGDAFLSERPLLGVAVATARADRTRAGEWLDKALRKALGASTTDERLATAELLRNFGRALDALRVLERARTLDSSPRVAQAWAVAAVLAGQGSAVVQWLNGADERSLDVPSLKDIFYAAGDRKLWALQVLAARKWLGREPTAESELAYGDALLAAGNLVPASEWKAYGERALASKNLDEGRREAILSALVEAKLAAIALPGLKDLARRKGGSWFFSYVEAANAAGDAGARTNLVEFLESELERGGLKPEDREARLYALLEAGMTVRALPHLKRFAESRADAAGHKQWIWAWEAALVKLNRKRELVDLWRGQSVSPHLLLEERRGFAFRLLESGEKKLAEAAFRELAAQAEPDSRDVAQLLHLWGPRPKRNEIDWLEARAAAASSPAAAAKWTGTLLGVLQSSRDVDRFRRVLGREIAATRDPGAWRRYARLAIEENLSEIATSAFGRVLAWAPHDLEALDQLGRLRFAAGCYADAGQHLKKYVELGGPSWEAAMLLGELAGRDGRRAESAAAYERALEILGRNPRRSLAERSAYAQLLSRTGRLPESQAAWNRLIREHPEDKNLLADYAATLLEKGKLDRAEQLLREP